MTVNPESNDFDTGNSTATPLVGNIKRTENRRRIGMSLRNFAQKENLALFVVVYVELEDWNHATIDLPERLLRLVVAATILNGPRCADRHIG